MKICVKKITTAKMTITKIMNKKLQLQNKL